MAKKPKRPSDVNQRAKLIVDILTGQTSEEPKETDPVKLAAAILGREGGKIGGKARAKKLSKARRIEIAKKAAKTRWKKK
jgi:hypothetical protein